MKSTRKIILFTLIAISLLIVIGSPYQWQSARSDRLAYPAPGEILEIDGLQTHIDCRGKGEPTLILEAGLSGGSSSWALVHDALSEITRTCAYDRPGLDWSSPDDQPISAPVIAERLHSLLSAAGCRPPAGEIKESSQEVF